MASLKKLTREDRLDNPLKTALLIKKVTAIIKSVQIKKTFVICGIKNSYPNQQYNSIEG